MNNKPTLHDELPWEVREAALAYKRAGKPYKSWMLAEYLRWLHSTDDAWEVMTEAQPSSVIDTIAEIIEVENYTGRYEFSRAIVDHAVTYLRKSLDRYLERFEPPLQSGDEK